jgi:hypothetical protein
MIVSRIAAEQYGWKPGDGVEIDMNGVKRRFLVVGTALPTGMFQEGFDKDVTAVVPRDYLAALYDIRGKVTTAYVRAREEGDTSPR